jgi:hypothetical protein
MNFIKKIKEGKTDKETHRVFIRFGLGEFTKEEVKFQKTKKAIKFAGGIEYVNAIHKFMSTIVTDKVHLRGNIITTKDLEADLNESKIEFMKSKQRGKEGFMYEIDHEMSVNEYKDFNEKFWDCYLLLHMSSNSRTISVKKTKLPKIKLQPGYVRAVFELDDFPIVKDEFLFDLKTDEFKKIIINHTYFVDDIIIPKEFENDPLLARKNAIRKGKIKRILDVDEKISECEFALEA